MKKKDLAFFAVAETRWYKDWNGRFWYSSKITITEVNEGYDLRTIVLPKSQQGPGERIREALDDAGHGNVLFKNIMVQSLARDMFKK